MNGNSHDFPRFAELTRDLYILRAGLRIPAWMVMHQDDACRRFHDCPPEYFARVDETGVQQSFRDFHRRTFEPVLRIEHDNPEDLFREGSCFFSEQAGGILRCSYGRVGGYAFVDKPFCEFEGGGQHLRLDLAYSAD